MKLKRSGLRPLLLYTKVQMRILDLGRNLTLRPMQRPKYYDYYQKAVANTWSVQELDFSQDKMQLATGKFSKGELHMLKRIVAFFATGDEIVNDNVTQNLYKHVNSPEYKMYITRQGFEEVVHVDGYLKLLDVYLDNEQERAQAFEAIDKIPSIKAKGDFCFKWLDQGIKHPNLITDKARQDFLLSLLSFGLAVEGIFFISAFAYIYFLRNKGLAQGFAILNDWVARDETMHMEVAVELAKDIIYDYPQLWTEDLKTTVKSMIQEAVKLEIEFAHDVLSEEVTGLTLGHMTQYIQHVADQRLISIGLDPIYKVSNPFDWMVMQGMQPLTNFFEKRVSEYQTGIKGEVAFDEEF